MAELTKPEVEQCAVKVEGSGTFEQNVNQIKKTFAEQGWHFVRLMQPLNDEPKLLFSRQKM